MVGVDGSGIVSAIDAARHGWRWRDGVRPHHHFQRETMWQAATPLPMEAKKGEAALRQAFLFVSFSFRCVQNMKVR